MRKTHKNNLSKKNNLKLNSLSKKKSDDDKYKYIYLFNKYGFGNKVFNLIYGIYLYKLYKGKCIINYIFQKSVHNKLTDPPLNTIFPNSNKFIKYSFMTDYEFFELYDKLNIKLMYKKNSLKNINLIPAYDKLSKHNFFNSCFNLIYDMYNIIKKEYNYVFNINKKLITDERINYIKSKEYAIFHIRYGDKINLSIEYSNLNSFDTFLLYKPQYYIDMINKFIKKNILIVIITDSVNIVNKFILCKDFINNKNIILFDSNYINSFYLFYYAKYIIMSCSTFSMAGAYFNNNNAICYLNLYHDDKNKKRIPEEYSISPKWIINNDKKYILNYDKKLLYNLSKYI
jgi:hypothetical protein